jgi:hypothetical protein
VIIAPEIIGVEKQEYTAWFGFNTRRLSRLRLASSKRDPITPWRHDDPAFGLRGDRRVFDQSNQDIDIEMNCPS